MLSITHSCRSRRIALSALASRPGCILLLFAFYLDNGVLSPDKANPRETKPKIYPARAPRKALAGLPARQLGFHRKSAQCRFALAPEVEYVSPCDEAVIQSATIQNRSMRHQALPTPGPASETAAPRAGGACSAASQRPRRNLWISLLLGLACLLVYNANLRSISAGDTYAARYQPFGLWRDHTLLLDP
jgi:hypothetical protein